MTPKKKAKQPDKHTGKPKPKATPPAVAALHVGRR